MVRKRLYAKQTASVEYEQIDLFSLLEEEQRQVDRTAEQVCNDSAHAARTTRR